MKIFFMTHKMELLTLWCGVKNNGEEMSVSKNTERKVTEVNSEWWDGNGHWYRPSKIY